MKVAYKNFLHSPVTSHETLAFSAHLTVNDEERLVVQCLGNAEPPTHTALRGCSLETTERQLHTYLQSLRPPRLSEDLEGVWTLALLFLALAEQQVVDLEDIRARNRLSKRWSTHAFIETPERTLQLEPLSKPLHLLTPRQWGEFKRALPAGCYRRVLNDPKSEKAFSGIWPELRELLRRPTLLEQARA